MFSSEYCTAFKKTILTNVCERLLLSLRGTAWKKIICIKVTYIGSKPCFQSGLAKFEFPTAKPQLHDELRE